jgi:hypothetical protein
MALVYKYVRKAETDNSEVQIASPSSRPPTSKVSNPFLVDAGAAHNTHSIAPRYWRIPGKS